MSNKKMKDHMLKSISQEIRYDGRKKDEWRPISVEYSVSKNAEGSAKVTFGETIVMAGVKMMVEKPYSDRPDEGGLMVGAELLAMSNPEFEAGPPSIQSIELARVIDRGIRESESIDTKKLLIESGEKAWFVSIDIVTINDAGNLMDAAGIAAISALKDAKFPKYEDGKVNYKELTKEQVPITKVPIPVTVFKLGNDLVVDPSNEEEKFADARLTVTTIENGDICAMQKGGVTPLSIDDVKQMVELAKSKAAEIRKHL